MSIQLTPHQQKTVDSEKDTSPCVVDPRTHSNYILVRAADYEPIRKILEDERRQQAIQVMPLCNGAGRIDDNSGPNLAKSTWLTFSPPVRT